MSHLHRQARRPRLLLLLSFVAFATAAQAEPPAGFAERVETLRKSFGAPGVSVAIVENGETAMARGFGVTDLSKPAAVNADTNFATGSTGKAFTAAALAILVDQGRMNWDDPVIDHMPDFRMYDAWVTREMTVRDLLVHRSGLGLGAGDLLFVPRSNLTRDDVLKRLRHIKPATSFRSGYAYDNILYIVAGQLIEEVSGETWEKFMLDRVLRPAGMTRVTVDEKGRAAAGNVARPHARLNGAIRGVGDQEPLGEDSLIAPVAAPAGGLTVSANDMARWLKLQLAKGALPNGRLFSEAQSAEMWRPTVLMRTPSLPPELSATSSLFHTYALGWNVRDYHGAKLIMHGGAVYGGIAMVAMIPEKNVGFYIALNSEDGAMLQGLTYELLDHYLGRPRADWPTRFKTFADGRRQAAIQALNAPAAKPAGVGPSLPIGQYAGSYKDPWFGTITIKDNDGKLAVAFPHWPGLTATLDHWQYNTFRTRYNDPSVEPAYVTFGVGADGKVDRITMKPVSPVADFSYDYQDLLFTPVPTKANAR